MTLSQLQSEVGEWSRKNFPNNQPYHPLLGVTEETGELAHAHLKMDQGIRGTPEEHKLAKIDAVADIMIYLANYCDLNAINMELAVETTWANVKQRDWQKNPMNADVQVPANLLPIIERQQGNV